MATKCFEDVGVFLFIMDNELMGYDKGALIMKVEVTNTEFVIRTTKK